MSKTSVHMRPCNVANSELHNKRNSEYIAAMRRQGKLYLREELSSKNETYLFTDTDLPTYLEKLKKLVKEKTGREMQTKERVRVNPKTGVTKVISGCNPFWEDVVVIREDTTIEEMKHYCDEVQNLTGRTPLQIYLHKDEGHYSPDGEWKPNLHAHVVWDVIDHTTGKVIKLDRRKNGSVICSRIQDIAAECLWMERGKSKAVKRKHIKSSDRDELIDFIKLETRQKELEEDINKKELELIKLRVEERQIIGNLENKIVKKIDDDLEEIINNVPHWKRSIDECIQIWKDALKAIIHLVFDPIMKALDRNGAFNLINLLGQGKNHEEVETIGKNLLSAAEERCGRSWYWHGHFAVDEVNKAIDDPKGYLEERGLSNVRGLTIH